MNIIITEQQLNSIEEMAYPSSWHIEYFKSLRTFKDRVAYCKQQLPYIGGGSSRLVFKIDNDKCLKLAKNSKGLEQNENEASIYNDYMSVSDVLATVYEYDQNNLWIEMQIASKCTPTKFKQYAGIDFNSFSSYLNNMFNNYRRKVSLPPEVEEFCNENEFIQGVVEMSHNFSLPIGDLTRLSSYGIVSDGRVVLIDYGLTQDTYDNFYKR